MADSLENPEEYKDSARIAMEISANLERLHLKLRGFIYSIEDYELRIRVVQLCFGLIRNDEILDEDLRFLENRLGINKNYLSEITSKLL